MLEKVVDVEEYGEPPHSLLWSRGGSDSDKITKDLRRRDVNLENNSKSFLMSGCDIPGCLCSSRSNKYALNSMNQKRFQ